MRLARWIFGLAGVYGLLLIPPMYFFEGRVSGAQPITHPEYYYGFLGVVLAWQIAFLVVASDPRRYRAIMLAAIVEKMSYVIAIGVLYWQQRVSSVLLVFGFLDFVLGILFSVAYLETSRVDRTDVFNNLPQQPTEAAGPLI